MADVPSAAVSGPSPRLVSVDDACRMLGGISRSSYYRNVAKGVRTVKLARRRLISMDSLEALIASRLDGASA